MSTFVVQLPYEGFDLEAWVAARSLTYVSAQRVFPALRATLTVNETLTAAQIAAEQGAIVAVGGLVEEGGLVLPVGAVADGQLLQRSGSSITGAAGGPSPAKLLAAASGDVSVSGLAEQLIYSFSIASSDIPSIGDKVQLEVFATGGTFASGTDRCNVYVAGTLLGTNAGVGWTWHPGNGQGSYGTVLLQRRASDQIHGTGWGIRADTQAIAGLLRGTFTGLTFPVLIEVKWVGGNASNAMVFKGFTAAAFNT